MFTIMVVASFLMQKKMWNIKMGSFLFSIPSQTDVPICLPSAKKGINAKWINIYPVVSFKYLKQLYMLLHVILKYMFTSLK